MRKMVLADIFGQIDRPFLPVDVATIDGVRVKLVRIEGAYPKHTHPGRPELFLVYKGHIGVEVDEEVVSLSEGEALVVPGGVRHCSFAEEPAWVIVVESNAIELQEDEGVTRPMP